MKKGWQIKSLGEVCAFDKEQGIHCHLPYVGLESIESHTARFIGSNKPQSMKSSTFRFSNKHVLYGRLRPYLNKVLAPEFSGQCSTEIFPIKPCQELSRKYLLYWFLSDETVEKINATCTGTRMPRADMNEVLTFEFPFPSLSEQQRIVSILDEAFENIATAKANAEKNLQNSHALFESHLNDVFTKRGEGWVERKLGDLFDITSSKRVFEADWKKEGVPFYRAREIVKLAKQGYVDNELFISEQMFNTYSSKYGRPVPGDIMVTGVGTLGICYVVKKGDRFYFKDGNIIWLKKKTEVDSRFVEHAFRSEVLRKQIDNSIGATVGTFTIIKAKSTRIPIPPISKQLCIVQQLDDIREETSYLATIYERKHTALEALKKSLLHQAFTGEL